jgi:hypothetical protein
MNKNLQPTIFSKILLNLFDKNKVKILGVEFDLRDQYIINNDEAVYCTAGEIESQIAADRPITYRRLALIKTITNWGLFWSLHKNFFYGLGTGLLLSTIL